MLFSLDEWPDVCILFLVLCAAITAYTTIFVLLEAVKGFYKFFLMPPVPDLLKHYGGKGTWAVLTGPDGGQARLLSLALAERGFNLLLLGYKVGCENTKKECEKINPEIEVRVVDCDFRWEITYLG